MIELLESRQFLSVPANINISRLRGNQSEGTIAIDPSNRQRLFAASNLDVDGLMASYSSDGGQTWTTRRLATGSDNLPVACCDPTSSFDEFGNLYLGYINASLNTIYILRSTDGGRSFRGIFRFRGDIDQPTLTTGNGSLWLTFQYRGEVVATGARVSGPGEISSFGAPQKVPDSLYGNFGDIAIGPNGQVMVTYMQPSGTRGPSNIYVSIDPDGLGTRTFLRPVLVTRTAVGGFRSIPAQREGKIDAEPGIVFDRSTGPYRGRVYMIYTHASRTIPDDTNTILRYSDDNGATWSKSYRVNDDTTQRSQFLPRMALDNDTGNVGVIWHDARNSARNSGAQLFGAIVTPTSTRVIVSPNLQISQGMSFAGRSNNSIDFGDYTGLAMLGGTMFPIWADNSNSTRDNPDGSLTRLDMYTALVPIT